VSYLQLGVDFIAALLVSLVIGYFLDQWLGTSPWMMIAMIPLGAFAGCRIIYRKTKTFFKEDDHD
jgi:ATP synthase protein I